MKHIIITLAVITFIVSTPGIRAGWFGNPERERRIQLEQQLDRQQKVSGGMEGLAFILGIGCVGAVVAGTILGSKAKRDAKKAKAAKAKK